MQTSLEHQIRERAYHLWIASGCGEGEADRHWFDAEREVLSVQQAIPLVAAQATPEPAAKAERKPAKPRRNSAKAKVAKAPEQVALS